MMAGEVQSRRFVIHPARFALWLFIISIILFFGGLTSAYIVSKGIELDKKTWLEIEIPRLFIYNTLILLVSSVTVQWSVSMARKKDLGRAMTGLAVTFLLGVFFLVGQILAWNDLKIGGVLFASSNAGDFLYLLTGAHGFHIIAGLVFVLVVIIQTARGKYAGGSVVAFENCATFWHFLDLLWIYLFIFLLVNH